MTAWILCTQSLPKIGGVYAMILGVLFDAQWLEWQSTQQVIHSLSIKQALYQCANPTWQMAMNSTPL